MNELLKMFKKMSFILGLTLILLITNISIATAEIIPIWPLEDNLLGLDYHYNWNNSIASYIGTAIGLDNAEIFKHLGTSFTFDKVKYDLNYGFWVNHGIPGYFDHTGFEGNLVYTFTPDQSVSVSVFGGEVGFEEREDIDVNFIFVDYHQPFYNKGSWTASIYSEFSAGQAEQSKKTFSAWKLILPLKYNDFKVISTFASIKQDDLVEPFYDITDFVRGYPEKTITGDRLVALTLEQQYPLFSYSENSFLSALNGVIFIDGGDVLAPDEKTNNIKFHSSIGVGVVLYLVSADIGLVETVTDHGDWTTSFYCRLTY